MFLFGHAGPLPMVDHGLLSGVAENVISLAAKSSFKIDELLRHYHVAFESVPAFVAGAS